MPYVQIPKDLNTIKEKVALNLTKRQLICFPIGIVLGTGAFFATKNINMNLAVLLLVSLAMPSMFIAMYEKNGFHVEKIIKHYIQANFIHPKIRVYKTENIYAAIEQQIIIDEELKLIGYQQQNKNGQKRKNRLI